MPNKRVYLDTSLLLAALVHESATAAVCSFLHHAEHDIWQVSRWVDTELASALAMQTRRGVISAIERDEAFTRYQILSADICTHCTSRLQIMHWRPACAFQRTHHFAPVTLFIWLFANAITVAW